MARGLQRYTENNPDHSEILLDLSAALCQHFAIISKDFAIFLLRHNNTIQYKVQFEILSLFGRARIGKEHQVC